MEDWRRGGNARRAELAGGVENPGRPDKGDVRGAVEGPGEYGLSTSWSGRGPLTGDWSKESRLGALSAGLGFMELMNGAEKGMFVPPGLQRRGSWLR